MDRSEMWKFYWSFRRFHLLQQQQQKHRKKGYQPNIYLREWAIKTELKYRARIYDPDTYEHKSIEKREYQQVQQPPNSSGGIKPAVAVEGEGGLDKPVAEHEDKPSTMAVAATEEGDENKSSLANLSNQMVISIGKIPLLLFIPLQ